MTTSAAYRPHRHACSDKNPMSVLDPDVPEQLKLLNFVNFITNELAMTVAFIVAIFVANFPEAFSSASMLKARGPRRGPGCWREGRV